MLGGKEERREWSNGYKAETKTCRKLTRQVKDSKEKLVVRWAIDVSSNSPCRLGEKKNHIWKGSGKIFSVEKKSSHLTLLFYIIWGKPDNVLAQTFIPTEIEVCPGW